MPFFAGAKRTLRNIRLGGFSPLDIDDNMFWFDASDLSTLSLVGTGISQWSDKGPNSYHITQSTGAARPQSGTRTHNSLNVADFNGSSHYLIGPTGMVNDIHSGDFSLYFIWGCDDSASQQRIINSSDGTSSSYFYWLNTSPGSGVEASVHNYPSRFTVSSLTTGVKLGGLKRDNTTAQGRYDLTTQTGGAQDRAADAIGFGSRAVFPVDYFNGFLAEIVCYNRAISSQEEDTIIQYLSNRWDLGLV